MQKHGSKVEEHLAEMPVELAHIALDTLMPRLVQTELVELLLIPKSDTRFTSCVLVHGMGGTGKVSEYSLFFFMRFTVPPCPLGTKSTDGDGNCSSARNARASTVPLPPLADSGCRCGWEQTEAAAG